MGEFTASCKYCAPTAVMPYEHEEIISENIDFQLGKTGSIISVRSSITTNSGETSLRTVVHSFLLGTLMEHRVSIHYCPMCGRKLKKED